MKILVTGGGGFLGTHLIKELLKNKSYLVTNFSRHSYLHLEEMGVPTIKGDLKKSEDIKKAMEEGFDVVFHLAALGGQWGRYDDFLDVNYHGTRWLLEHAKSHGVKRFIYTSTPFVVVGKEDLLGVGEEVPYATNFLTPYAETKSMAEKIVLQMNDHKNFLTCALRPQLMWGPGDPHLFPQIIQKGKEGKLRIVGDGENLVDVLYVENAARAHVQAMEHLAPGSRVCGETYFLGQERPVKLWDFINQVLGYVKVDPVMKIIDVETAYRLGWFFEKTFKLAGIQRPAPPMTRFNAVHLGKSHYFSHAKARRDFGYSPLVSIEEGLKKTFAGKDLLRVGLE